MEEKEKENNNGQEDNNTDDDKKCSFCGRRKKDTEENILVTNDDKSVRLCAGCAKAAVDMIMQKVNIFDKNFYLGVTPQKIKEELDKFVIGQEEAKKLVSVAVYKHVNRESIMANTGVYLEKSNVILVGPTGVGKTLIAEALAETLGVPMYIADATGLTEAGYVGNDIENVLWGLIETAGNDVDVAEHGIIYIDEVDKIARSKGANPSISRDVSGEGVQQSLLRVLEGGVVQVPVGGNSRSPLTEWIDFNTKNVLFILGGAFNSINNIREERLKVKEKLGFGFSTKTKAKEKEVGCLVENELKILGSDLIAFGLIPEFVGRITTIAELENLNEDVMRKILIEPKNSIIDQYKAMFKNQNIELDFEEKALDLIVQKSMKKNVGARALKSVLSDVMADIVYNAPSLENLEKCIVTSKYVESYITCASEPLYKNKKKKLGFSFLFFF